MKRIVERVFVRCTKAFALFNLLLWASVAAEAKWFPDPDIFDGTLETNESQQSGGGSASATSPAESASAQSASSSESNSAASNEPAGQNTAAESEGEQGEPAEGGAAIPPGDSEMAELLKELSEATSEALEQAKGGQPVGAAEEITFGKAEEQIALSKDEDVIGGAKTEEPKKNLPASAPRTSSNQKTKPSKGAPKELGESMPAGL